MTTTTPNSCIDESRMEMEFVVAVQTFLVAIISMSHKKCRTKKNVEQKFSVYTLTDRQTVEEAAVMAKQLIFIFYFIYGVHLIGHRLYPYALCTSRISENVEN